MIDRTTTDAAETLLVWAADRKDGKGPDTASEGAGCRRACRWSALRGARPARCASYDSSEARWTGKTSHTSLPPCDSTTRSFYPGRAGSCKRFLCGHHYGAGGTGDDQRWIEYVGGGRRLIRPCPAHDPG